MTHQDKVFADSEIRPSATLSLGRIEHSNFAVGLENRSLSFSFKARSSSCAINSDLRDKPAIGSHRGLDRDFVAIPIFCLCYVEYGED